MQLVRDHLNRVPSDSESYETRFRLEGVDFE